MKSKLLIITVGKNYNPEEVLSEAFAKLLSDAWKGRIPSPTGKEIRRWYFSFAKDSKLDTWIESGFPVEIQKGIRNESRLKIIKDKFTAKGIECRLSKDEKCLVVGPEFETNINEVDHEN